MFPNPDAQNVFLPVEIDTDDHVSCFVEVVRSLQGMMEIDGIRYQRLDGEEYYLHELFDSEELVAFLNKNAVAVDNSIYDHIIYDSGIVERPSAVSLDDDPDVKMFYKIPDKFKIETPIDICNPDWAVYLDRDGVEKLYFVLGQYYTKQDYGKIET